MSKKVIPLITRHKTLQSECLEWQKRCEEYADSLQKEQKKLIDSERRLKHSQDECRKFSDEIESVHQILDALPNPIGRKTDGEESWSIRDRPIITRLAAWLSSRTN